MKTTILKIITTLIVLVYNISAYSQTTTLTYTNSGLSTTACNVFNPQQTIGGVVHQSYAGSVGYSTTEGLVLNTSQSTPIKGTAFVIKLNTILHRVIIIL